MKRTSHEIECYDYPCVHFSRKALAYIGYCSCGEEILGKDTYAATMMMLTEHMNSCKDAVPDPAPTPKPVEAIGVVVP